METRTIHAEAHVNNRPEAVLEYIADVRHRPLYIDMLQSVSDIQGDPAAAGTTWRWTWGALGLQFEGTARCLEHQPGRLYRFQSEGGIRSTWTYTAAPENGGTHLALDLEYEPPPSLLAVLPVGPALDSLRQNEIDKAVRNLKQILDE
jgi:hypothetical protein